MPSHTATSYIAWITPIRGDPTHSLLRAHLLFEQLLDEFLAKSLPHSKALADARFTFAQKLAVARAAAKHVPPSHWTWQAVTRLNKLRNSLAHSPGPKLATVLQEYVNFCIKHSGNHLPEPDGRLKAPDHKFDQICKPAYTAADMVTIGLYIDLANRLGFDIDAFGAESSAA